MRSLMLTVTFGVDGDVWGVYVVYIVNMQRDIQITCDSYIFLFSGEICTFQYPKTDFCTPYQTVKSLHTFRNAFFGSPKIPLLYRPFQSSAIIAAPFSPIA